MIQDISSVPEDLKVPEVSSGLPGPGRRVRMALKEYEGTDIHHLLYLPQDWKKGARHPVIVEYAGNGGYRDGFGDTCDGTVEGSRLGYGISEGKSFIWLCLPYVDLEGGRNQTQWWGDVEATAGYCRKAVELACSDYGGDPASLLITGFSRGAIACNFIGLHDDRTAALWAAFAPFSHYDGVREWSYAGSGRASALERLKRLKGRPQFICNEGDSCAATEEYLRSTGVEGSFVFQPTFFRNHSDAWILRDCEARRSLRAWLSKALPAPLAAEGV